MLIYEDQRDQREKKRMLPQITQIYAEVTKIPDHFYRFNLRRSARSAGEKKNAPADCADLR
jgi:hypothetical protein